MTDPPNSDYPLGSPVVEGDIDTLKPGPDETFTKHQQSGPKEAEQQSRVPMIGYPESANENSQAAADQKEAERQQRIAKIAKRRRRERRKRTAKAVIESLGALATVGLACLTVAYVYYSGKQWQTMEKQLEMSERPWISINAVISTPLTFNSDGGKVALTFSLKNVGHSPAAETFLFAKLVFLPANNPDPAADQRAACERFRTYPKNPRGTGSTVFPNDTAEEPRRLSFTADEMEKGIIQGGSDLPRSVLPFIVGCADYKFEFAERHHQTGFIFYLANFNPETPGLGRRIAPGQPTSDVRLFRYPLGSGDAD